LINFPAYLNLVKDFTMRNKIFFIFVVVLISILNLLSSVQAKDPDPCAKVSIAIKRSTDSGGISGIKVLVTNFRGQSATHTTNSNGEIILDSTEVSSDPVLTNTGYTSGKGHCGRSVSQGKTFKVTANVTNVSGFSDGSGETTLSYSNPAGDITIYLSPE
jgi:hypothetical protein